ncbi:LysR family transcriptional regulator [Nonomuraea sp. NPDC005650]|uniref:LysR family transcriptional regulator n=1 Tax=Nonomuraea sp. NPDC005650 TaxID=3157045 RepID=UPI00339DB16C
MEVDQIAAFLAIARQGGFTRASEALHISQPAISRRIRLLEQELGAPLFERVGRGVMLSEGGRAFLPYAEMLVTVMRDSLDAVRDLHHGHTGELALAFVGTLAGTGLTGRLRDYRRAHPGVRLRIRTATSDGVSDLVRRGEVALGLRYDDDSHPDLLSTRTYDEELVPIAAPEHPLAASRHLTRGELAAHPWITFPPRTGETREPYANALRALLGQEAADTTEIVPIDSLTAQISLVEAGFGLAMVPRSAVERELNAGRLRALDVAAASSSIPVVLVERRQGFQSGAVKAMRLALLARDGGADHRR